MNTTIVLGVISVVFAIVGLAMTAAFIYVNSVVLRRVALEAEIERAKEKAQEDFEKEHGSTFLSNVGIF